MNILKALFVVLAGLAAWVQPVMAAEVWKFTSLDWEPYSGKSLTEQGTSVKLLKDKLEAALGVEIVVEFYPWKRAQALAQTGGYVGYFPAWPEEVQEGFIASPAVDWSEIAVLKIKDTVLEFISVEQLFEKYRVGLVETYTYPQEIEAARTKHAKNAELAPDETLLAKKLQAGRNQAAITDPSVMKFVGQKVGVDDIEVVKVLEKKELVIALRNDQENQERIARIRKALE